jgi:hypothetical protein
MRFGLGELFRKEPQDRVDQAIDIEFCRFDVHAQTIFPHRLGSYRSDARRFQVLG